MRDIGLGSCRASRVAFSFFNHSVSSPVAPIHKTNSSLSLRSAAAAGQGRPEIGKVQIHTQQQLPLLIGEGAVSDAWYAPIRPVLRATLDWGVAQISPSHSVHLHRRTGRRRRIPTPIRLFQPASSTSPTLPRFGGRPASTRSRRVRR